MANVIIVAEKPSAARAFEAALGGRRGKLADRRTFEIANLRGHLYEHKAPMCQPRPGSAQSIRKLGGKGIGNWVADPDANPDRLPWNHREFLWSREPKTDVTRELAELRRAMAAPDLVEIMCATDLDPTGEGGLLFEEVATELGWVDQLGHIAKPGAVITRAVFHDESPAALRQAVKNAGRQVIASKTVSLYDWDEYRKAVSRARLDYLSQQYVQISTMACGNQVVLRQGRLKSAMLVLIADQQAAHDGHVKQVFYADQLVDENGVVYTHPLQPGRLTLDKDDPALKARLAVLRDGEPWPVKETSRTRKRSAPPRLLDLSALAGKLSHLGSAEQVLSVYQKMYEAGVVSYPRTEDKHVTPDQFRALLANSAYIASVVGVDDGLLTRTSPRPTHVKDSGAHGANRPGPNVPESMGQVRARFGPLGAAIYDLVARHALAMLAEDYIYTQVAAVAGPNAPDGPYEAKIDIAPHLGSPDWGWREVIGIDPKTRPSVWPGRRATARLGQHVPKRPNAPTVAWLMAELTRRDIGTGSTRVSTLSAVVKQSSAKTPALVEEARGKLTLTEAGQLAQTVIRDTALGDLDTTKRIQDQLAVLAKSGDLDAFLDQMAAWVRADAPKILAAAKNAGLTPAPDRHHGQWVDPATGKTHQVSFPKQAMGFAITDQKAGRLLAGQAVTWSNAQSKAGNIYAVKLRLDHQEFNGRRFVGLSVVERGSGVDASGRIIPFADSDAAPLVKGVWNGERVEVKPVIARVNLGDDATCRQAAGLDARTVAERLLAGGQVLVRGLRRADGSTFDANVKIGRCEYKGRKYVGLVFGDRVSHPARQGGEGRRVSRPAPAGGAGRRAASPLKVA
ncbi:MAG: hypothetical protein LBG60_13220 [Bifidobacteriaceae bacterium]|jgi:DNA topoisomerase-3|nr:hypothetical protein [Bifidobacteriaceae bacterium]